MGNNSSTIDGNNHHALYTKIDNIASKYILTMEYKTIQLLNTKQYCDKLLVMISSLFYNKCNDLEIKYILHRIEFGKGGDVLLPEFQQEKTHYYVDEGSITSKKMDVTLNNDHVLSDENKHILCKRIAKFYILVAHIFASIMQTIHPIYTYIDDNNEVVEVNLIDKENVPLDKEVKLTYINFCSQRVDELKKHMNTSPTICKLNVSKESQYEPSIYAFENLYFNDSEYDYSAGQFTNKSEALQQELQEDLKTFYTAYTGKEDIPSSITKFSDIRLKDFNAQCIDDEQYDNNDNAGSFAEYAENLKKMMIATTNHQQELLKDFNIVFEENMINPDLTEENIYKMIRNIRKKIIKMYTDCEYFYNEGIEMNNRIVDYLKQRHLERQSTFFNKEILHSI